MILYHDTENEMFFEDYKPLPVLRGRTVADLRELYDNILAAAENAYCYHADLLCMALKQDSGKVNLYIRMYERKEKRC